MKWHFKKIINLKIYSLKIIIIIIIKTYYLKIIIIIIINKLKKYII